MDYDAQPGRMTPSELELTREQLQSDDVDLHASLRGLGCIVAGARGVDELLAEVAQFAARAIPGADGAGVTMIEPHEDAPRALSWAVTADFVHEIDRVQYDELKEGPCITCMDSRRPTVSGSLGSDSRWPRFGGRIARIGVHSALSLPLLVDDQVVGAINTYARDRDAFGDHAVQMGSEFAGPAAVSVYNAHLLARAHGRAERLQGALVTRAVIDQAIGILRSRSGDDAEQAFGRLVKMSQSENVKLHDVAERLVEEAARRARARHRTS